MSNLVLLKNNIYVSELKLDYIKNIINLAENLNGKISKIILFGSSLESRCTEDSDIDIAVFTKFTKSVLYKKKWYINFLNSIFSYNNYYQRYDILVFKDGITYNSLIYENIMEGEVIYESNQK